MPSADQQGVFRQTSEAGTDFGCNQLPNPRAVPDNIAGLLELEIALQRLLRELLDQGALVPRTVQQGQKQAVRAVQFSSIM